MPLHRYLCNGYVSILNNRFKPRTFIRYPLLDITYILVSYSYDGMGSQGILHRTRWTDV